MRLGKKRRRFYTWGGTRRLTAGGEVAEWQCKLLIDIAFARRNRATWLEHGNRPRPSLHQLGRAIRRVIADTARCAAPGNGFLKQPCPVSRSAAAGSRPHGRSSYTRPPLHGWSCPMEAAKQTPALHGEARDET